MSRLEPKDEHGSRNNPCALFMWRYQSFLLVLLSGIPLLASMIDSASVTSRVIWSVLSILVIPILRFLMWGAQICLVCTNTPLIVLNLHATHSIQPLHRLFLWRGGLKAQAELSKQLDWYSLKNGRGCCNSRLGDSLIPFYSAPFQLGVLARSFSSIFVLCHLLVSMCMLLRNLVWRENPAENTFNNPERFSTNCMHGNSL